MNVNEVWGRASFFLERLIVVEKKRNIMKSIVQVFLLIEVACF